MELNKLDKRENIIQKNRNNSFSKNHDKQKADKYLYLSLCFCHRSDKAEEQHSLSKHDLEPFTCKGLTEESEWREDQNNLINSLWIGMRYSDDASFELFR